MNTKKKDTKGREPFLHLFFGALVNSSSLNSLFIGIDKIDQMERGCKKECKSVRREEEDFCLLYSCLSTHLKRCRH